MVFQTVSSSSPAQQAESVIVVIDAHRNKGTKALDWALKHVVRPKDSVLLLEVIGESGKKTSCFPFNMGIGISGIWERLEFSNPKELEDEIERKREQYQSILQPFYRQCKKNEVKLEVKIAAGYEPRTITVEEAQKFNTRWIVLDSYLKREKAFIYEHVGCNVAVMKEKDVATLMLSKAPESVQFPRQSVKSDHVAMTDNQQKELQDEGLNALHEKCSSMTDPDPQIPQWYPLSWRTGFPRAFSHSELEVITNGFADENIVLKNKVKKVYRGILQETLVLVKNFSGNDEQFWSTLKILSRVRHRNIMNLVGYCCTGDSRFMLSDYPCMGTLEINLQDDESAKNLPWKARRYIALEIGGGLRYLHEECLDGPIVHLSVCSSCVVLSHGCSAMLGNFMTAKCLKDDVPCSLDSPAECRKLEEDELLSVDVRDYGMLLVELITGKSSHGFQDHGKGQPLIDWALPLLENGSLRQLMDPRLMDDTDTTVAQLMADAALRCLKNDSGHKLPISEVYFSEIPSVENFTAFFDNLKFCERQFALW
ncbi:hypothetical protein L1049_015742 [Liquidambar formosana]|uniref:Protein kinase domain-containing protein n=1 Tax=Liquidambar formosana TaxID=63359 RepID=A0AAP0S566_LIQFO